MALIVFHYIMTGYDAYRAAVVVAVAVAVAIVAVMEVVDVAVVPRKGISALHSPPHPTPDQPCTLFPPPLPLYLIATPFFLHIHVQCTVYNMYCRLVTRKTTLHRTIPGATIPIGLIIQLLRQTDRCDLYICVSSVPSPIQQPCGGGGAGFPGGARAGLESRL